MMGVNLYSAIVVFLSCCLCSHCRVLVNPAEDAPVPLNSAENVTYTCTVTGEPGQMVEAVWSVQGIQVPGAAGRTRYEGLGVFITPVSAGVARVVVTEMGRTVFGGRLELQCIGTVFISNTPMLFPGQVVTVSTFDSPGGVVGLSLDPASSDNLDELLLSWQPPIGGTVGVAVTYDLSVTGLSINIINQTNETSIMIVDRTASTECRPHVFSVIARNRAGPGPLVNITRTIPIAPDLSDLNNNFAIGTISLTNPITLSLTISLATTCSQEFPIEGYTLKSSDSVFPGVLLGNGSATVLQSPIAVPGLTRGSLVDIFIEVCISITCRNSTILTLRTSAVQSSSLLYFENNIFMMCEMASSSPTRGCQFILSIGNLTEVFDLLSVEGTTSLSQCNQTMNLGEVYDSVVVVDILESDNNGLLPLTIIPEEEQEETSYTTATSCDIPIPPSALSAGGIVGIVLAALLVSAAVLAAVIVLIVCRIKTGHWFKIKEKDDHLTVNFAKHYLLSEGKQARKKKSTAGHNSPDIALQGEVILPHSLPPIQESDIRLDLEAGSSATAPAPAKSTRSSVLADTEDITAVDGGTPVARSSATAPLLSSPESQHAFTLDISSDNKKVKLHLNKALIMQKLQERRLDTMNRNKILKRQVSYCKLPMTCEMRVHAPEDK